MPTLPELQTMYDYQTGKPVVAMKPCPYWSSTTYAGGPGHAWVVDFYYGVVYSSSNKSNVNYYVRCVRGGQFDSLGHLIIPGVSEGSERITVNDDGTVTDNLTGLTWE